MRWPNRKRYAELARHVLFDRAAQLQMVLPDAALATPPPVEVPAGFALRMYQAPDEPALIALMRRAGFERWGSQTLAEWLPRALPDGYFLVVDERSARLAATTLAAHHPSTLHPFGGELCWLAVDPDYRGRGLGRLACAATTRRLIGAGYRRIYLTTDDERLAAIRLYVELGYVPFAYDATMPARWDAVYARLGRTR
jgi:mycothiol synthase